MTEIKTLAKVLFLFVALSRVSFSKADNHVENGTCARSFPEPLDSQIFKDKVADGETEWVALFFYVCPYSEYFAAFEHFRSRMTVEDSVFTRTINYREKQGEECVGAFNQTLNQTDPEKAVFQRPLPNGNIREDRYIDTGHLDDFVIQWTCTDTKEDNEECQSHFAALYFRGDKPENFPWSTAVTAFEDLGIESRNIIMYYANGICPLDGSCPPDQCCCATGGVTRLSSIDPLKLLFVIVVIICNRSKIEF